MSEADDRKLTILIVDDNVANRLLLSSQLEMEGYHIEQAVDGEDGISKAEAIHPDLILLDVMMPKKNGFEVCEYLKSHATLSVIPIVMVTALRDVQYRIKGIEVGADEFLYRPHHREELLVRVQSLIQLKRTRQRLEEERNRLQLLYDISQAISSQLDLDQMMANIIKYTQMRTQATKGNIMLLGEQGAVIKKYLIRAGAEVEIAGNVAPEVMNKGLAGWLIRQKRAEVIQDVQNDSRWVQLPDDDQVVGSAIGVPLTRATRIAGVLLLMHPEPGYFTQEHLILLETIGGQITTAIENAFLFAEIDDERRKLGALLSQSTDAIFTTDEEWRVLLFNRAAEAIFSLTVGEVAGKPIQDIPKLKPVLTLFEKASKLATYDEVQINGAMVLYGSVTPVKYVGYVAVLQNITELKQMEAHKLELERVEKKRVQDTFSRYMSPTLVEQVLANKPGLLAMHQKRFAVVMFADLRGFTRMIVNLESKVSILVLNEYFTKMTDVVYEFEGTIFDLAGDELMVGFNVPIEQPDAPARALMTAIQMQKKFDQLQQEIAVEFGMALGLGIGIDQGHVVVGNVGAETRMNFAMVGEAVNTAHRLVDLAEDGQIVVSAGIQNAIVNQYPHLLTDQSFTSMGNHALKGKKKREEIFLLQSPRTVLTQ